MNPTASSTIMLLFSLLFFRATAESAFADVPEPERIAASQQHAVRFEVVSIRPSKSNSSPQVTTAILPNGYSARNQSLWSTMMIAFGPRAVETWRNETLKNVPSWAISELYDVDARVSEQDIPVWRSQGHDQPLLRASLEAMLRQRCGLQMHKTSVPVVAYILTSSKSGLKLKQSSNTEKRPNGTVALAGGGYLAPGPKDLAFFSTPLGSLVAFLSSSSDRPIVNDVPSQDTYSFILRRQTETGGPPRDPADSWDLDDLGLSLRSGRTEMPSFVVDRLARPSAN